eukprot:CAMPEP_0203960360 /NCGR_PEP_ID=MMETSP0359-20131031/91087_1 /ASSEMBLY_ACC=CAM_ASM_000338 /TAXON_ID=268821 /ORGANISM="Scrippsiella Hangoei, Strain SHTV-5" /LENGTH=45 /DNA_ID= /DNA_START= /DNA_END= /DNA_ORIENTATION=
MRRARCVLNEGNTLGNQGRKGKTVVGRPDKLVMPQQAADLGHAVR